METDPKPALFTSKRTRTRYTNTHPLGWAANGLQCSVNIPTKENKPIHTTEFIITIRIPLPQNSSPDRAPFGQSGPVGGRILGVEFCIPSSIRSCPLRIRARWEAPFVSRDVAVARVRGVNKAKGAVMTEQVFPDVSQRGDLLYGDNDKPRACNNQRKRRSKDSAMLSRHLSFYHFTFLSSLTGSLFIEYFRCALAYAPKMLSELPVAQCLSRGARITQQEGNPVNYLSTSPSGSTLAQAHRGRLFEHELFQFRPSGSTRAIEE